MKLKRFACLLLMAALVLSLSACVSKDAGEKGKASTAAPLSTDAMTQTPTTAPTLTPEQAKQIAEGLIKHAVEELYEKIGEPLSSSYSSSCTGPGEDGELYYNGFTVYTYKEEGKGEVITFVY